MTLKTLKQKFLQAAGITVIGAGILCAAWPKIDRDGATEALAQDGYTNIEISESYPWSYLENSWRNGGEDELSKAEFTATNANGGAVHGVVTRGFFTGYHVRPDLF